jgi:predicted permease
MTSRRRLFRLPIRRRSAWEREVDEEILLHLSLRAEQLAARGLSADAAREEAIRRFGPMNESRAELHEAARQREGQMKRTEYLEELGQDVGFAMRAFSRNPGWTAIAVGTLALGIAATTAVWNAASTLLLHPLSYPNAGRVVIVDMQPTGGSGTGSSGVKVSISAGTSTVTAWRTNTRAFEMIEPWTQGTATLTGIGEGRAVNTARILPSFVRFAGQRPLLGTGLTDADVRDRLPIAVIGEGLWRTAFAGDSSVIGRTIVVDGVARRVVGVYPTALRTPLVGARLPDVWLPIDLTDVRQGVRVVGRLRPGITPTAAQKELTQIDHRAGLDGLPFSVVVTVPGKTIDFRDSLLLLAAAVAVVLLVACANIAHLIFARGITRERELAIRRALGAASSRLARLLVTESLVLAVAGTAIGLGLGYLALRATVALRPAALTELRDAHVDGTGLLMVMAASVVCGILFGIANVVTASRRATADALRGVNSSTGRRSERLRSLLVVSEMAMSGLLLVGAVLLVRTVVNLQHTDLGYDPSALYGVTLDLPNTKYATTAAKNAALGQVEATLARSPHVRMMTVANDAPDGHSFSIGALEVFGEPRPPASSSHFIEVDGVAANFFRTIGARFTDGRTFTDTSETSKQVIINAGFAHHQWADRSAIGQRIRISFNGRDADWLTVVGVVDDILMGGPGSDRTAPRLFFPRNEHESPSLIVRTDGSPDALPAILGAARVLKPTLAPSIIDAQAVADASIAGPKFIMTLLATFTVLAVLLAAIGLYGMMSYAVVQRTREFGIRIALGATPSAIGRSVLVRGTVLALVGAGLGMGLAVWGTRLIQSQLYGVSALDVTSYVIGASLLIGTAAIACIVPTRRAVGVDPVSAIRAD